MNEQREHDAVVQAIVSQLQAMNADTDAATLEQAFHAVKQQMLDAVGGSAATKIIASVGWDEIAPRLLAGAWQPPARG